ncbi:sensor histidine kinase [Marivirga harenae]|uniref:sensor histidine kinase n=1 Tax=Marivirga harenae TaxID=2010992 RepID=UPI0026E001E4|nr:HAMP domain-containing sensor histidine kinase [Marivirga harenae]WKV11454.1 HAMP domain-containing sensor histidine kinase [Marivirga harenae]
MKWKKYVNKKSIALLLVIVISSLALIFFNYYVIKITASIRSYINGESNYSKGQKDASFYLLRYLESESENDWIQYQENMLISFGPRDFRVALLNDSSRAEMHRALIQGRNNPDDTDNYIWLYKNFGQFSFMQEAVASWTKGDHYNEKLDSIAHYAHAKIAQDGKNQLDVDLVKAEIIRINKKLSEVEYSFSDALSRISRKVEGWLKLANVIFVILIVGGSGTYFLILIKRLEKSEKKLIANNTKLEDINAALDRFAYSVSHDLRAPISSLKGLVELLKLEGEQAQLPKYLNMMNDSLKRQDEYIKNILLHARNRRMVNDFRPIQLSVVIDEILTDLIHYDGRDKVEIKVDVPDEVVTDENRLKIVLSNLISNAIKYRDDHKVPQIEIFSSASPDGVLITVQDNGIGIQEEYQSKIYNMFFVTNNSKKGTGLGMYIAKEAIQKMNASISLASTYGSGTRFDLFIPHVLEDDLDTDEN